MNEFEQEVLILRILERLCGDASVDDWQLGGVLSDHRPFVVLAFEDEPKTLQ